MHILIFEIIHFVRRSVSLNAFYAFSTNAIFLTLYIHPETCTNEKIFQYLLRINNFQIFKHNLLSEKLSSSTSPDVLCMNLLVENY